jgi:hypothetical protein
LQGWLSYLNFDVPGKACVAISFRGSPDPLNRPAAVAQTIKGPPTHVDLATFQHELPRRQNTIYIEPGKLLVITVASHRRELATTPGS